MMSFKTKSLLIILLATFSLAGCSTLTISNERDELEAPKEIDISEYEADGVIPSVPPKETTEIPEFKDYNKDVEVWIKYFTGRGRHHMEKYLARSGRYAKRMQEILREEGLPEDLLYVALIESGFSHEATSHAQAVGYWQFIRGTGKRYGLEISASIDERRDPILATRAAARYLRDLYGMFGNWHLAMASYNAGENRIMRASKKYRQNDFWKLSSTRKALPRETRQYVPKFLAARLIAKNPRYYQFANIEYETPLEYTELTVDYHVDLKKFAESIGIGYEVIARYNPRYRHAVAAPRNGALVLRIPTGYEQKATEQVLASKTEPVQYVESNLYRVRPGDSLSVIARRHRVGMSKIMNANGLTRRSVLRVGQRLNIPGYTVEYQVKRQGANIVSSDKLQPEPQAPQEAVATHIVRRGENLFVIAKKYKISLEELRSWNSIGKSRSAQMLRVGQRLKVIPPEEAPSTEEAIRQPSSEAKTSLKVHIVRKGETLSAIAVKHQIAVHEIIRANNLVENGMLMVGTQLMIPKNSTVE